MIQVSSIEIIAVVIVSLIVGLAVGYGMALHLAAWVWSRSDDALKSKGRKMALRMNGKKTEAVYMNQPTEKDMMKDQGHVSKIEDEVAPIPEE